MDSRYKDTNLPIEERVQILLSQMTLEEKTAQLDMTRGVEFATVVHPAHFCAVADTSEFDFDAMKKAFGDRGIGFVHDTYSIPGNLNKIQRFFVEHTRLGIPCMFTGEALHGLSYPGCTIYPVPLALGATFDPDLVKKVGKDIGREARILGIHEILAPNLDVSRDPRWGRTEETFGEDTYLSSCMAAAIISGEQGENLSKEGVLAEPKHYCVHGIPEGGRNCAPARVGNREIESCYLPVFEAGICKGGARNVMASYNCIDGEAVISSEHYLREILHGRWGMKGYVRADFGAVRRLKTHHHMTDSDRESIKQAFHAGLQVQGFDFPTEFWEKTLADLVRTGEISEALLDDAVARVIRTKFELGLFEQPYVDEENYRDIIRSDLHRNHAYQAAAEGVVLLKNRNQILPVSSELKTIALLGPCSAKQQIGGYSSVPYGYAVPSVYEELKKVLGDNVEIRQCDGCEITENHFEKLPESWYVDGVELEYYKNGNFEGSPVGHSHEKSLSFNWILSKPHRDLDFTGYSVRMKGSFRVDTADFTTKDQFEGKLIFKTGDSIRLWIDGKLMIDSVGDSKQDTPSCFFVFRKEELHEFVAEFICDVNGNDFALGLDYYEDTFEKAIKIAKESDLTILVCGDDNVTSGEGMDRCSIKLYGRQNELIQRVAALGKPVALVLENGKAVDLQEASEKVDAIIAAWFGGELGARVIAEILTGRINPSGRLPVSFPRGEGQLPCYYSRLPGGSTMYLEGDSSALYPFGHGLSYTKFTYENMKIEETDKECCWNVSVQVSNTGSIAGDEVVQMYVSDIQSSVVTPDKLLKGFQRISLQPRETKSVSFVVDFDSLKLLNKQMQWVVETGDFEISIGASSEDIRLKDRIYVNRMFVKNSLNISNRMGQEE